MTAISINDASARLSVRLPLILAAYFAVQALLRIFYASSLGLDEAELMVTTQAFVAGHGSQPPLYSWIQIVAFEIFGLGIPALALVKNLLLLSTFIFVFFSARLVLEDDGKAAIASLALFTIPQLAWESQRALSHTVIVVAAAAATLYVMLRLMREGRPLLYALFGVCLAAGTLSKYNYILFAVALFLAALTIPAYRARLRSPWIIVTLLITAALLLPHLIWLATHTDAALSRVHKFEIAEGTGIGAFVGSFVAMLEGTVNYAVLPVVLFLVVAFVPFRGEAAIDTAPVDRTDGRLFISRLLWIALGLVLVLALATRTTEIRDRWLQPLLFALPLGLFILFEHRLAGIRARLLASISTTLGIVCMIGLAVAHLFPDLSDPPRATVPYVPLAEQIRGLGFQGGYILANDSYVAGNLRLRFPDSTVAEPAYGFWPAVGPEPSPLLIAWDTDEITMPDELFALWRQLCGESVDRSVRSTPLTARFEHSQQMDFTLHVAVLPMCTSNGDNSHASTQ